jgi:hypothetical protein
MLARGTLVPAAMYLYLNNAFGEDETYLEKRLKQELSSTIGAYDYTMWF